MRCRGVALRNYRNTEAAEVTFGEGVNILYGANAQGKTNLLEAVYHAAIGRSFRALREAEVVRFGCESAYLSVDYEAAGRPQNVTIQIFRDRTRAILRNRVRVARVSELVGSFRAVLFCPAHLSLVKDGPAERRQFLDVAVSALEPAYLASLQRYGQVLRQRNALLRAAREDRRAFDETGGVWSDQLAREGAYLARSRSRYAARAGRYVAACFGEMTGGREVPALAYLGCAGRESDYEDLTRTEEALRELLRRNTEREIAAGTTLFGVHKDDLELTLNGQPARSYASQGQQRSLALALKIAEGEICRDDCGEYPVLLLDDVLSELDAERRRYLLRQMTGKQVILTSCEPDGGCGSGAKRIRAQNGAYVME